MYPHTAELKCVMAVLFTFNLQTKFEMSSFIRSKDMVWAPRYGNWSHDPDHAHLGDSQSQWCIAKNGGGYTHRAVEKGLKVPCLFMITEVSIRCQKKPGGWYTAYTRVYPPIHHWSVVIRLILYVAN